MKSIAFFSILLTVAGLASCKDQFSAPLDKPLEASAQAEISYEDEVNSIDATDDESEPGARMAGTSTTTYMYWGGDDYERKFSIKGWFFGTIQPAGLSDTTRLVGKTAKAGKVFNFTKTNGYSKSASAKTGWWLLRDMYDNALPVEVAGVKKTLVNLNINAVDGALAYYEGAGSVKISFRTAPSATAYTDVNIARINPGQTYNEGPQWKPLSMLFQFLPAQKTETFRVPPGAAMVSYKVQGTTTTHSFPVTVIEGKTAVVKITLPPVN